MSGLQNRPVRQGLHLAPICTSTRHVAKRSAVTKACDVAVTPSPVSVHTAAAACPAQDCDSARKRVEALGGEAVEDVNANCPPDVLLCTSVCADDFKVCARGPAMVLCTRLPRRDAPTPCLCTNWRWRWALQAVQAGQVETVVVHTSWLDACQDTGWKVRPLQRLPHA